MSTAQRRPELMSLLPNFTRDGAEYWDKDAVPVDLTPLHGFHGFFSFGGLPLLVCRWTGEKVQREMQGNRAESNGGCRKTGEFNIQGPSSS